MVKAAKWGRDYQTITDLTIKDGVASITFRNGDAVRFTTIHLKPPRTIYVFPRGGSVSSDGSHLKLSALPHDIEISWDIIRRLSDPEFAQEAARLAVEQAKYIGSRLRELRERRGLTQANLAQRTGIQAANLSRLENDHFDIATSTLWKLLAAMGYTAADLAADPSPAPKKTKTPKASRKQRRA